MGVSFLIVLFSEANSFETSILVRLSCSGILVERSVLLPFFGSQLDESIHRNFDTLKIPISQLTHPGLLALGEGRRLAFLRPSSLARLNGLFTGHGFQLRDQDVFGGLPSRPLTRTGEGPVGQSARPSFFPQFFPVLFDPLELSSELTEHINLTPIG